MEVNTLKRKLKAEEDEHKALNTLWEVGVVNRELVEKC